MIINGQGPNRFSKFPQPQGLFSSPQPFGTSGLQTPVFTGQQPGPVDPNKTWQDYNPGQSIEGNWDFNTNSFGGKAHRTGGFAPVGINPNRLPAYNSLPSYGLRPPSNTGTFGGVGTINTDTINGNTLQGMPGNTPFGNPDMNVPASPANGMGGMARSPLANYGRGQNQGFYA